MSQGDHKGGAYKNPVFIFSLLFTYILILAIASIDLHTIWVL